jgi:hypothetical protein
MRYSGQCLRRASSHRAGSAETRLQNGGLHRSRLRNAELRFVYSGIKSGRIRILSRMHITMELVDVNLAWLRQALALVERIDDEVFARTPRGMAPHRVGSHLRHVLEFYECFLDGLEFGRIDYDSRKRNEAVERHRTSATAAICSITRRMESVSCMKADAVLDVRMENAEADVWLTSSMGRELQALSSHTIHHFALMAVTLRLQGVEVHPDFGMSPSTLRYQAARAREAA